MGELISVKSVNENLKFITKPVWIDYVIEESQTVKEKKHISLIALKNIKKDTYVIHHLSNFIIEKWGYKSFNTQKKHATNIVKFLNYLIKYYPSLKIKNLAELTISHGSAYLNWLGTNKVSQDTVKDAERTLVHFYTWGINKLIFSKFSLTDFKQEKNEYNTLYYKSPFTVVYPQKKIKEIEHILPFEYIPLFLEIASTHTPRIALGIYLQIFGGLRVSEVVNLKRTQISKSLANKEIILKIENQNFRTDLKEHASVKKTRSQVALDVNGWGTTLIRQHLKLYSSKQTNALFLNTNEQPMSGRSYRQYFDKCKIKLISTLETSNEIEHRLVAQHLKSIKWSTHIGRGTFTNLIANEAQNPYEIAHLRGDSSLESALSYMASTPRMHKKIEEKLDNMHEEYIPNLIERKLKSYGSIE
ncbi:MULTISPECIES: tyrosine-type recombinase/integrase [Bacillus cereus group]|uniref:tyrosine-type recombinase/integrase n=1 Tax=Bacillus cereus group TaxID=86661 RepID=UPI0021D18C3C|nr:phage integrase N-terminal SAM-like domain-containing protein [Bacillus wiedmannii]MCU5095644.1 phage integrase N-terminal SAM-like domain-containing protein [Bacillus wiedmannii]